MLKAFKRNRNADTVMDDSISMNGGVDRCWKVGRAYRAAGYTIAVSGDSKTGHSPQNEMLTKQLANTWKGQSNV